MKSKNKKIYQHYYNITKNIHFLNLIYKMIIKGYYYI